MGNFDDFKWDDVEDERITEILRQAELRLADQLSASFSKDQRASAVLSTLIAISLAAMGACGSLLFLEELRSL